MGDKVASAKARRELEDLYLGIPDESVNLTFKDLAQVKLPSEKIKNPEPINEAKTPKHGPPLIKLPSLDFSRGLQESRNHHRHHDVETMHASPMNHRYVDHKDNGSELHDRIHRTIPERREEFRHGVESSMGFDNASVISMASMYQEKAHQRRRPGIPHSNICTVCSNYIYIFRHRCLVCGRVYCRDCLSVGMGEMTEGRKCIECLGRRFSQRYIRRAGRVGWCSRYPSAVKQAELKWAEKGPRRSGEQAYGGRSPMMSRPRSPLTPTWAHVASGNATPSFVANSSAYSPYNTPIHHHLPL